MLKVDLPIVCDENKALLPWIDRLEIMYDDIKMAENLMQQATDTQAIEPVPAEVTDARAAMYLKQQDLAMEFEEVKGYMDAHKNNTIVGKS